MIIKNEGCVSSTVVVFGSLRGNKDNHVDDIKPYDFLNTLNFVGGKLVFVQDSSNTWYNNGFDDSDGFVDALKCIGQHMSGKTIFLGHSSGGYAAILYGCLLGADRIISFSPQIIEDYHWPGFRPKDYFLSLIECDTSPPIDIIVCDNALGDVDHIRAVEPFLNVTTNRLDCRTHNSAKFFIKSGKLQELLEEDNEIKRGN